LCAGNVLTLKRLEKWRFASDNPSALCVSRAERRRQLSSAEDRLVSTVNEKRWAWRSRCADSMELGIAQKFINYTTGLRSKRRRKSGDEANE